MANSPWPAKFVGSHILISEKPPPQGESWDHIPADWKQIRFDAVDVLFISPFYIKPADFSMVTIAGGGKSLMERFKWVVRAARSMNPNIKIVVMQFYQDGHDFGLLGSDNDKIDKYADSAAGFIGDWYDKSLPSLDGNTQVSARINGWDVDVEGGTLIPSLPKIVSAVRANLDKLADKLNAETKFSVSITPYTGTDLDASMAQSCDSVNMQNYSGGQGTPYTAFTTAIPGLKETQLAWGITSEEPQRNTAKSFDAVKARAQDVINGKFGGIYTWRLNSDNFLYESVFQVWLYNFVHGASLPGAEPEEVVRRKWPSGGRN